MASTMIDGGCFHRDRILQKKFMNDISTSDADSRMCWVSKDQKFHVKNEFGSL